MTAWRRFRSWHIGWQIASWVGVAFAALTLIGLIGNLAECGGASCGDNDAPAAAPDSTETVAPATPEPATPSATVAEPTSTPEPTLAPEPTATATPVPVEQQFAKSYRDNRDFMVRASAENLAIAWDAGLGILTIRVKPSSVLSNGDFLTIAGHSAIVAGRAIWTTYPAVQILQLSVLADFISATGQTTEEIAAFISVDRSTAATFDYDGLKIRELNDNKAFFCVATIYRIHLSIYSKLGDPGCLALWGAVKF